MMLVFRRFIYMLLLPLVVSSCAKDSYVAPAVARTVMVYMAANNSLANDAYTNLNQMEEGFVGIDGKLIVYARIFGQQPKIYEIVHDRSPEVRSKVLKTYTDHNSSDPEIMKMVFADMKQLAAAHSYGAILWSHATNWAPADIDRVRVRSFGDDNFRSMDVHQLRDALPKGLDFLIFDACSMASVEVLYELKDIAPYILASPTEVLSVGMPYHEVASNLYDADIKRGLVELATAYVSYYQKKVGLEQSATYSLVETAGLSAVARETQKLFAANPESVRTISRANVQRLDLDPSTPVVAFDFWDMLLKNFTQDKLSALQLTLDKAVVYKAHTSNFLGKPIRSFSGLSTYIPVQEEGKYFPFYRTLAWYKSAGYDSLFWWQE